MKRQNYLNNKDMLKEIHKSKTNFCSYIEPEYNQYDIILLDVNMPIMNGIECCKKIRMLEFLKYQPYIIIVTAHVLKDIKKECILCVITLYKL